MSLGPDLALMLKAKVTGWCIDNLTVTGIMSKLYSPHQDSNHNCNLLCKSNIRHYEQSPSIE